MTLTDFLLARITEDEGAARGIPAGSWEDACSTTRRHDHVFRWSPGRVLAECEAKRRIVDMLFVVEHAEFDVDGWTVMKSVVKQMALPYADHPDYSESWRP